MLGWWLLHFVVRHLILHKTICSILQWRDSTTSTEFWMVDNSPFKPSEHRAPAALTPPVWEAFGEGHWRPNIDDMLKLRNLFPNYLNCMLQIGSPDQWEDINKFLTKEHEMCFWSEEFALLYWSLSKLRTWARVSLQHDPPGCHLKSVKSHRLAQQQKGKAWQT